MNSDEKMKTHKFNFVPCDVCGRGLTINQSYVAVLLILIILLFLISLFTYIAFHVGYVEGQVDAFLIQSLADSITTTGELIQ